MANFKIGQKVVFVGGGHNEGDVLMPKKGEIVTIHSPSPRIEGNYYLSGYLYANSGHIQSCHHSELRPIEYFSAEEVIENVEKEINE